MCQLFRKFRIWYISIKNKCIKKKCVYHIRRNITQNACKISIGDKNATWIKTRKMSISNMNFIQIVAFYQSIYYKHPLYVVQEICFTQRRQQNSVQTGLKYSETPKTTFQSKILLETVKAFESLYIIKAAFVELKSVSCIFQTVLEV